MNQINLIGRLCQDAETRISAGEDKTSVTRFTLAVNNINKKVDGKYDTDFIKCVAFNKLGDTIASYTEKGSQIAITGRLHTYQYKTNDGDKKQPERTVYMAEVVVQNVQFLTDCKKNQIIEITDESELPFK